MDNLIPAYLQPNANPLSSGVDIQSALQLDMNWQLPGDTKISEPNTFWGELAEAPAATAEFVYSTADGAWSNVKDTAKGALGLVTDAVDAAGNRLNSFAGILEGHIFLIVAGLVVAIWFLAKSGILTQVAAILAVK